MRNLPENQEVLVGAGTVRCEDGPITFNTVHSLKLHEENISRVAAASGFRRGLLAATCLYVAIELLKWMPL